MPIHLPPISRRGFLAGSLAASADLLLLRSLAAEQPSVDPNCFVLLADSHVGRGPEDERHGVKPAKNLKEAVPQILALPTRPAAAMVVGDCAFMQGTSDDYATFGALISPLRQAGVPMHLLLGNHDDREHLLAAFPDAKSHPAGETPVAHKHVSILETPHVNWFLLDSLEKTNVAPGSLGEAQLAWLAAALDARPDKPAIIVAHHNLDLLLRFRGLTDGAALLKMVMPRKQVKAYFCGHMHWWKLDQQMGLHMVALPALAWLFDPTQPRGFVTVQSQPNGATLQLYALDQKHPKHGQKIELKWRV